MRRRRVIVMIDTASRDAFTQLLVIKYLRWRGVDAIIANQASLIALCEWHRPHVVFASWLAGGSLMEYLSKIHRRTQIVLVDQEGGRLGDEHLRRSFEVRGGAKREIGTRCARILAWGRAQARCLAEVCGFDPARIIVTGSPRFDPYRLPAPVPARPYLGVTLRGDAVTALPTNLMQNAFEYAHVDEREGFSPGFPRKARYEDRMWHVFASTRCTFRILTEVSRRTSAPIVVRPGPWEQERMYGFLPGRIPSATVRLDQSQPAYIRGAFAVVDESSSLSIESYVAGRPTISTQALIPGLEQHIGGDGGTLFNAPYAQAFWRPGSVDEAADLIVQAEQGRLAPATRPDILETYLRDFYDWPSPRPSSFRMADVLLELLDVPHGSRGDENGVEGERSWRNSLYRNVPGLAYFPATKLLAQSLVGRDRQLLRRYHYHPFLYPFGQEVSRTFADLLTQSAESR